MDRITVAISTDPKRRGLEACVASVVGQNESDFLDWQIFEWDTGPNRTKILESSSHSKVLFLDSDCRLPDPNYISRLLALHENFPQIAVMGGSYRDDFPGDKSDHAYNHICNAWIRRGINCQGLAQNLVGGCLFIDKRRLPVAFRAPTSDFWGGEDTLLMRSIWQSGAKAKYFFDLEVIHQPHNTLKRSVMRGLRQGWNRSRFNLKTPGPFQLNIPPIKYWPWWAIHFSAVEIGSTLAKLSRQASQRSSKRGLALAKLSN